MFHLNVSIGIGLVGVLEGSHQAELSTHRDEGRNMSALPRNFLT